jgi:hypothetical protein
MLRAVAAYSDSRGKLLTPHAYESVAIAVTNRRIGRAHAG